MRFSHPWVERIYKLKCSTKYLPNAVSQWNEESMLYFLSPMNITIEWEFANILLGILQKNDIELFETFMSVIKTIKNNDSHMMIYTEQFALGLGRSGNKILIEKYYDLIK